MTFGKLLRKTREARGISLREMAETLGFSAPYLSDVERGNRPPLVPGKAAKCARLLGEPRLEYLALKHRIESGGCTLERALSVLGERVE